MIKIEIDNKSGFCFGVVNAIQKAEEELEKSGILYCLGDIVHNNNEVERLRSKGLITINHEDLKRLKNVKVLLRAHGEPPETYRIAKENNIEIQVKNMFYHYGSFKCLDNVNITIEKGKKYAVVGVSGSGKSTLLKILANLLNDYQGEVSFNLSSTQKPIYLDQDTTIMDGTILENVLLGQKCTNERLLAVSNATGVDEVVKMQPHNWETEISKGKNLSRGQEQRVCLSRCLVKNADIYLLDEATSNIDVVDEERIMKALIVEGEKKKKKTVLISTHKLNMINYVDEVIYIKDRKVYQGSHEQLLESLQSYNAFINGKVK